MLQVAPCADESDQRASLDVYNAVWPHDPLTMEDVRSFKASVRDHVDYLARIDGAVVSSPVELRTRNEERNEPILRLSARFGYRPGIGRIYFAGPLPGP